MPLSGLCTSHLKDSALCLSGSTRSDDSLALEAGAQRLRVAACRIGTAAHSLSATCTKRLPVTPAPGLFLPLCFSPMMAFREKEDMASFQPEHNIQSRLP